MSQPDPVDEAREALVRRMEMRMAPRGRKFDGDEPVLQLLAAFEQSVRADALRIPEDSEFAGAAAGPRHIVKSKIRDEPGYEMWYVDADEPVGEVFTRADANLLRAAPALLARVRSAEAEIGRLREALAGLLSLVGQPAFDPLDGYEQIERARAALGEGG